MVHINKKYFTAVLSLFFITLLSHACAEETTIGRVLHFPEDYVVGRVYFRDKDIPLDRSNAFMGWGRWVKATGAIEVPKDTSVRFDPYKIVWHSGWVFSTLQANDVQFLTLMFCEDADDSIMRYIGRLTGLEGLALTYAGPIRGGLEHLAGFQKLKFLMLPVYIRSSQLAYLGRLPSLETLTYTGPTVTDDRLVQISKLSTLKELSICNSKAGRGLAHLHKLKNLRFLGLTGNRNPDIDRHLGNLAGLNQLEELSLENTLVGNAGLAHLKGMTKLQKLQLRSNPGTGRITDAGMVHLKHLKSLEELELPFDGITDAGYSHLAVLDLLRKVNIGRDATDQSMATVGKMKSLEDLCIGSRGVTDAGMAELANCLSLKSLNISRCSMTGKGFSHLENIKSLREVNIQSTDITDDGLSQLAKIESLKKLKLDRTRVTGEGLAALKELPNLKELHLRHINLGNSGISNIAGIEGLTILVLSFPENINFGDKELAQLSVLNTLSEIRIIQPDASLSCVTDRGLEHLFELTALEILSLATCCENVTDTGLRHLEGLTSLENLRLDGSRITMEGVKQLKKKIPEVSVDAPCTREHWRKKFRDIQAGRVNGKRTFTVRKKEQNIIRPPYPGRR